MSFICSESIDRVSIASESKKFGWHFRGHKKKSNPFWIRCRGILKPLLVVRQGRIYAENDENFAGDKENIWVKSWTENILPSSPYTCTVSLAFGTIRSVLWLTSTTISTMACMFVARVPAKSFSLTLAQVANKKMPTIIHLQLWLVAVAVAVPGVPLLPSPLALSIAIHPIKYIRPNKNA